MLLRIGTNQKIDDLFSLDFALIVGRTLTKEPLFFFALLLLIITKFNPRVQARKNVQAFNEDCLKKCEDRAVEDVIQFCQLYYFMALAESDKLAHLQQFASSVVSARSLVDRYFARQLMHLSQKN